MNRIFVRFLSIFLIFFALHSENLLGAPFAYVANIRSDSVSVIDLATQQVIATIPVGMAPQIVTITPDGGRAYVSNGGSDSVSAIDVATNTVIATITVGNAPIGIAITPDGARAYVANSESNDITIIDLAAQAVIESFPIAGAPIDIAITPDGTKAYIVTAATNSVSTVDLATNTIIATIPVGDEPISLAITPDGTKAYVVNSDSDNVTAIDLATNLAIATIPVGEDPFFIAIAPNGLTAYVSNSESDPGIVTPIDIRTNTAGMPIVVNATFLTGLDLTPDGSILYVAEADDNLAVPGSIIPINLATLQVGTPITVGVLPFGLAITSGSLPTVTSVSPNSGPTNGKTSVTITGTNFVQVSQVLFGDKPALSFIVNSSASIVAVAPLGSVGTVDIRVITSLGTSSITPADQFTYLAPIIVSPPRHVKGRQVAKFSSRKVNYINILTWKAPKGNDQPVEYRIYRDKDLQQLAGTVRADQEKLKFKDIRRQSGRKYTYFIVSVDALGFESEAVKRTITPLD